jgi:hypothetical protein
VAYHAGLQVPALVPNEGPAAAFDAPCARLSGCFGGTKGMPMVETNILLVDDDKDTCASMSDIS